MANWRDTFKSKTDINERTNRLAEQQQAQVQTQYAGINRLDITAASKQVTSEKLLNAIKSDGPAKYEALGIVKILINFKSNEKKGGDANQAITALEDLERHAKVIPNLTAQELMEFVKNRSAFFQRQIPETFKQLLISVMPSNINALVTAENGAFLISNGVINDQQLGAVVNRQIEEDLPPLDKIRTLFDLISRKNPSSPFLAQTYAGAVVQSGKDGFRVGLYVKHPESVKHYKNFLYAYILGSQSISAKQEDSRFRLAKGDTGKVKANFSSTTNPGFVTSQKNILISDAISGITSSNLPDSDKKELNGWLNSALNKLNAGPINLSGKDYKGTWAFQQTVSGTMTQIEKDKIFIDNNRRAYAASRKSADLSNGPQFTPESSQGNLIPSSFNSFLAQSGAAYGMDEAALVVFSQNQRISIELRRSWSGFTSYFEDQRIHWDILSLLSDIAPDMYEKLKNKERLDVNSTKPDNKWSLLAEEGSIQYDFTNYKSRIVKYKYDIIWTWKNKHRFYETIEADVKITWNIRANYVHYEFLNRIHRVTLERLVFPHNDPHMPKYSPMRYGI